MYKEIGIDVSHWQGNIDWGKVGAEGISFAILKAGGSDSSRRYKDKCFEANYANAKKAGIKVGAYYFAGNDANSYESGLLDAFHFSELLQGKRFEYPVVLDFEKSFTNRKMGNTDYVCAFCQYMEGLGYYVMVYASDISGFKERLDIKRLDNYDKWVARYGKSPEYVQKYGIWQHSSEGHVNGIEGNVDLDISYKDYASIIGRNKLNGF